MAAATIITSVLTGGTNSHQSVAEEFNAYATDFVNQGVVGSITTGVGSTAGTGSFAVSQDASPDMGVTIASGVAYVSGTPSGQDAQVLRARMTSNYTAYTINANASGSTKYDWIYLQLSATNAATPDAAADNVINLYTSRSSSNSADNGTPPTYGILLAIVTVANGAINITNSNITDKRTAVTVNTGVSLTTSGWSSISSALTYSANNGNKEFVLSSAVDLTGSISTGMKLKVTRSATAPTQCMSFTAASSQYATKASPTGITFTSAFTCEAWVYLNSYGSQLIVSRVDGTYANGFWLQQTASGQVEVAYASASSSTTFTSYQSIPLKRWVHIAAAVTSVASKTAVIYINGTSVPLSASGTNTTLTQAGNVGLGGNPTTAGAYFDGYISEARVWSVAQTQANIQANMAISLTGSETNLVALFQGNGNFNDKTSNANNLTATNGAIATQAANPYNNIEYGIVTKVTSSQVTVFTGTDCNIPNMTLNSPQYSTARAPYGFPTARGKWRVSTLIKSLQSITANSAVQDFTGVRISVPTGDFTVGMQGSWQYAPSSTSAALTTSLSTTQGSGGTDPLLGSYQRTDSSVLSSFPVFYQSSASLSSQTIYYTSVQGASNGTIYLRGDTSGAELFAECAYL